MFKKSMSPFFLSSYYSYFLEIAGNEDMHIILDEFEFRPDWTRDKRVSCP